MSNRKGLLDVVREAEAAKAKVDGFDEKVKAIIEHVHRHGGIDGPDDHLAVVALYKEAQIKGSDKVKYVCSDSTCDFKGYLD